jgi:hypothetical protein
MAHKATFAAALLGLPFLVSGCSDLGDLLSFGEDEPVPDSVPLPGDPASAGDFAAYESDLAQIAVMPATGNMPTAGTASMQGQAMMALTNTATGVDEGDVMADVAMLVDFDPAAADPVNTTLSNIQYMDENGAIWSIGGALTSDPEVYQSTITQTDATIDDGAGNATTITTGGLETVVTGDINDGIDVYDMTVNLEGDFVGDGAQAAVGTATGTVDNLGSPGTLVLNGTFWVQQ